MIRKKTLRLLLCDYQRTAHYYTIYRTFKSWLSDDFTTIPRLFYWRNYDYWLRLFQKLLRLFQPERCDYCSPLLAIGRKPEKRCGGSRQWFRAARRAPAAGLPRRVERASRCAVTAGRCQIASRRAWEVSRRRRNDPVQVETPTPQQVRRVQQLPAIHKRRELPPPGWHGSITGGHLCTLIYIIIIGGLR